MQRMVFFVVALFIAMSLSTVHADQKQQRQEVLRYLKSGQEPQVKDAMWATDFLLKIGVFDNGSQRDGFADYVCLVLAEHGMSGQSIRIEIIDYGSVVRGENWKVLGGAECK
ncbi:hypothetical protein [Syntrophotalea acetylenica]|uniref:Uncharacterized protein n=1 Tax=Syntrophotalea acetylenica TaxID=29542 RepID=A0A1L3GE17_SYNAC|nr:hypothetical protein [Syntrophotalea acetylenica]APG24069.1 hypothetical protein A7E75_02775 [Syntrophotalea acetylenica]APG44651.1 hypothetical protein A6070_11400 [Syntrophotalea acetylenica]APG45451.1 hypothetical protein A6070_14825 [Syntrophotalea acetylenica]